MLNESKELWDINLKREEIKSVARASSTRAIAIRPDSQSHRRVLSARPASLWSIQSEASIFQSSNRHRLLNRLASGFSTTGERIEVVDLPVKVGQQPGPPLRSKFVQLTVDIAQARTDQYGFALFSIDLRCSIDTTG